ncbi:MAG TPA: NAD(P)/FAD-dependent oxidoreductase [Tepidisphaeraceae bacterium]|nr:NAD(P)/FAD-dependent oxidoreductase [Tepidisphaeraceae bacterium]
MDTQPRRIVIVGGGFSGVYTAIHLERFTRHDPSVRITLVSSENYFLMSPLLFEAGSGILEPRHAVNPIRPLLDKTQFVEAEVKAIDVERRTVTVRPHDNETYELPYDHLVLALGGVTNTSLIPGSDRALTFKTLGDAIYLRNQVIRLFEWGDVEKNPRRKQAQLTFVVVGAGLVGVELMGELTTFIRNVSKLYKNVDPREIRFEMIEAGPKIAPEFDDKLAEYSAGVLEKRGVRIRTNSPVKAIRPDSLELPDGQVIEAATIVVATGVAPNPLVASLPIEKDRKGRAVTDAAMRVKNRTGIWALGDCAQIPDPSGKPYPPLAQHALREAKQLAKNIALALRGSQPQPFVYETKGTLAALGHFKGAGRVYGINIHGFFAWWVWRTYYVMRMPKWSRRLRIIIDWTVALFFKNDVVQLDVVRGNQLPEALASPRVPADGGDGSRSQPPRNEMHDSALTARVS